MRFLYKSVISFSLFLVLCPAHALVNVEQLVIVYSPEEDWNQAFVDLHERVSPLLAAAKAKKMRVVLYMVSRNTPAQELKANLEKIITGKSSWVVAATHGGAIQIGDRVIDTSLSFSGGIRVSELSDIFNAPGVTGVALLACHSFSEAFKTTTNIACASAAGNKEGNSASSGVVIRALADAVKSPDPVYAAEFLREHIRHTLTHFISGRKELLEEPANTYRWGRLSEEQSRNLMPPVAAGNHDYYLFHGKRFEIVDESGQPTKPCVPGVIDPFDDLLKGLAGRHGPYWKDGGERYYWDEKARIFPGIYQVDTMSALPDDARPHFRCGKDGKWRFRSPERCAGLSIKTAQCKESYANRPRGWKGIVEPQRWMKMCAELEKRISAARTADIEIQEPMCLTGCFDHPIRLPEGHQEFREVMTAPGACSIWGNGRRCEMNFTYAFTRSGSPDSACCGGNFPRSHQWDSEKKFCKVICFDVKLHKEVKEGQCFSSELPVGTDVSGRAVSDREPIFGCPSRLWSERDEAEVTDNCCEEMGRSFDWKTERCLPRGQSSPHEAKTTAGH